METIALGQPTFGDEELAAVAAVLSRRDGVGILSRADRHFPQRQGLREGRLRPEHARRRQRKKSTTLYAHCRKQLPSAPSADLEASMPRTNRSVPADAVLPHVIYHDLELAIRWLGRAFGFVEHYRYGPADGPADGMQVRFENAWLMLERARAGSATPSETRHRTQYLTLFIDDVDAHYARAKAAGATIVESPAETVYGEYLYAATDLAGHRWIFSRHAKDVRPQDWGATVA